MDPEKRNEIALFLITKHFSLVARAREEKINIKTRSEALYPALVQYFSRGHKKFSVSELFGLEAILLLSGSFSEEDSYEFIGTLLKDVFSR